MSTILFPVVAIFVFFYYRKKYVKKAKAEIEDYISKTKKADS